MRFNMALAFLAIQVVLVTPFRTAANDLPTNANPSLRYFGYHFADGRSDSLEHDILDSVQDGNVDHLDEVRPFANLYVAVPSGYVNGWNSALFAVSIGRAKDLGFDILLGWDAAVEGGVIYAFQNNPAAWTRVKFITIWSERLVSRAVADAEVDRITDLLKEKGLSVDGKRFGVDFARCQSQGLVRIDGPADLCGAADNSVDDSRFASKIGFVSVQAYVDPVGSPVSATNQATLNQLINTAQGRIGQAGKTMVLIGQSYDRGGLWTNGVAPGEVNVETLKDLQAVYYNQARLTGSGEAPVEAVLMFNYARQSHSGNQGGARYYPELQVRHIQIAERIIGSIDGDADGMSDLWERLLGLNPATNDAGLDPDLDGIPNGTELLQRTHPKGAFVQRFAEGAESSFFDTYFGISNPGTTLAHVLLRFQRPDGSVTVQAVLVPALSRTRVYADIAVFGVGETSAEFSTAVESDTRVVVDRMVRWDQARYGSHLETAAPQAGPEWNFAEGSTNGFNLFYLVQNPNPFAVTVVGTYLLASGGSVTRGYNVAASSRLTIWTNQDPGLAASQFGATFTAANGVGIVVERSLYRDSAGVLFSAGHGSMGVRSRSLTWIFAEGATGSVFDLFVLVANPSLQRANITATYLLPNGTQVVRNHHVEAQSRYTIWVDAEDALLANTSVSTKIEVTNGVPVTAERAMWWPGPSASTWLEAHNAFGATETGLKWAIADAEVDGTASQGPYKAKSYVLIANVSPTPGRARVTIQFSDPRYAYHGSSKVELPLAAGSRTDVDIWALFPSARGRRFGVIVESIPVQGQPLAQLVVERSIYWDSGGVWWAAGASALAQRLQ